MRIIPYDEPYRDDMLFVVLSAKDALGRVPRLNPDLLDVRANYIDRGDAFFLALDEDDSLITTYYGADTARSDAEALQGALAERYADCDVELQQGGQPLYYYLIAVE